MTGRFFLSFASGATFELASGYLATDSILRFGSGFENVILIPQGPLLRPVPDEEVKGKTIIMDLNEIGTGSRVVELTPMQPAMAGCFAIPTARNVVKESVGSKTLSTFEAGSSSKSERGKDEQEEESEEFLIGMTSYAERQFRQLRKHIAHLEQKISRMNIILEQQTSSRPALPYPARRSARAVAIKSKPGDILVKKKDKVYSFRKDCVRNIFGDLIEEAAFQLPEPTKPEEAYKFMEPDYCHYHQFLGHTLEDCSAFKDWIERNLRKGTLSIPQEYFEQPPPDLQWQ